MSTTASPLPKNSHAVRQSRPTERTLGDAHIGRSSRRARVSHATTHHALLTHATSRHAHARTPCTHAPGSSSKCPPSSCDEGRKKSLLVNSVATTLSVLSESLFAGTSPPTHTATPNTHTTHNHSQLFLHQTLYIKSHSLLRVSANATGTCTER